jgi:hypothetical protein
MAFSASKLQQHLHLTSRIFLHAPNVVPGPMCFQRPAARDHGLGSCPCLRMSRFGIAHAATTPIVVIGSAIPIGLAKAN